MYSIPSSHIHLLILLTNVFFFNNFLIIILIYVKLSLKRFQFSFLLIGFMLLAGNVIKNVVSLLLLCRYYIDILLFLIYHCFVQLHYYCNDWWVKLSFEWYENIFEHIHRTRAYNDIIIIVLKINKVFLNYFLWVL